MKYKYENLEERYVLMDILGTGGTAVVYKVWHKAEKKPYAAKCFLGEEAAALHEIWMLGNIRHPLSPAWKETVLYGNNLCLVMDLAEGPSLKEYLAAQKIPLQTAILWTKQICFFLEYLHTLKPPVYYCDLKPANLIVLPNGNLKLIDFGAARQEGDTSPRQGTREYAAMELFSDGESIGSYTDIYSLGKLMEYLAQGVSAPRAFHPGDRIRLGSYRNLAKICQNHFLRKHVLNERKLVKFLEKISSKGL